MAHESLLYILRKRYPNCEEGKPKRFEETFHKMWGGQMSNKYIKKRSLVLEVTREIKIKPKIQHLYTSHIMAMKTDKAEISIKFIWLWIKGNLILSW